MDVVTDRQVIAGLQHRQPRCRDRRRARWARMPARWGPSSAVPVAAVLELAVVRVDIIRGRIEQGWTRGRPADLRTLVSWPAGDFLQQDTEDRRHPLDPALQSLCDALQLPSRRTLRGLPRLPISCMTDLHVKMPVSPNFEQGMTRWAPRHRGDERLNVHGRS